MATVEKPDCVRRLEAILGKMEPAPDCPNAWKSVRHGLVIDRVKMYARWHRTTSHHTPHPLAHDRTPNTAAVPYTTNHTGPIHNPFLYTQLTHPESRENREGG